MSRLRFALQLLPLALAETLAPVPALAVGPADEMEDVDDQAEIAASLAVASISSGKQGKGADVLAVPLPITNPTLGTGIVAAGVAFYNPNDAPSPWITGAAAMKTNQGNWMVGALHSMSLGHDRYRISAALGTGKLVMKFYGIGAEAGDRGDSIQLHERFTALRLQGQARVAGRLYAGARGLLLKMDAQPAEENGQLAGLVPSQRQLDGTLVLLGPSVSFDTRDDTLNPRQGLYAHAEWLLGMGVLGSDYRMSKLTAGGSYYVPAGPRTTWALHAGLCAADDAPFYAMCLYGQKSDLRGYASGRYRDGASWALQGEWRRRLAGRFGMVAFAGIGGIAPSLGRIGESNFLPSAGAGLRFRPSRQTNVNLRLDLAVGWKSQGLYLGIAEAF